MTAPASVAFVFLDGVGLGPRGAANPLSTLRLPAFERLADGAAWAADAPPVRHADRTFVPLDATLGLDGLPQSGTGQAALFTGENAAALHGRHFGPYPPSRVRPVVAARSVFAQLASAGLATDTLAFANAYPGRFFDALAARGRWTVTTLAASSAGVRLRRAADLVRGEALAADLTGAAWRRAFDPDLAVIDEAEAGRRLAALAAAHRFTLFEYFLTDKAGHSQDPAQAAAVLHAVDRFLGALTGALDPSCTLLVVCSDHGNLEDLSVKTHTRNPVPLAANGAGAGLLADARSILDVTPRLVRLLAPSAR